MSKRHTETKPLRPPKPIRKKQMRQVRHSVAQDLHSLADAEGAVLAEPVVEHFTQPPTPRSRRRRHWKMKDWKRRTNERRARNAEMERLARADD